MNRFVRWLKRPVALNYATVVFCFLQGATLSIPAAIFLQPLELFEPPKLASSICVGTAIVSSFLLPRWCWAVREKKDKGLALFGFVTGLLILFGGLLFPALSTT